MPVSSLIVRTETALTTPVGECLADHPLVTVTQVTPGAIAVVTETPDNRTDQHLWKQIEGIDGVTHLELIYHNFEDLEEIRHEAQ